MEKYEEWTKNWKKWKYEWVDSKEKINCFLINTIPPERVYSSRTHCELVMAIAEFTGQDVYSGNGIDCIQINDKSPQRPFIRFHTEKAQTCYPKSPVFKGEIGMAIINMKSNKEPIDILDIFGFISYELHNFTRSNVLKTVVAMETIGFGVLHDGGIIGSLDSSIGTPSTRHHTRLPNRDDPVWLVLNRRLRDNSVS